MQTTNKAIYEFARSFLLNHLPNGITSDDLKKYYSDDSWNASSLKDVFTVFIQAAQDYQSMPNSIKFVQRKDKICQILEGFDYTSVSRMSEEELYKEFRKTFSVTSTDSHYNNWYKWSCSIIDSAKFLTGFTDFDDFDTFVRRFDYNSDTRMALPLLLSTKIRGVGFALACNVLKDLGYIDYPKPDIHMIDICEGLELSNRSPYNVFHALIEMATDNNVSPFEVDRTLWLICSGNYYLDSIKGKPRKTEFITEAKSLLH